MCWLFRVMENDSQMVRAASRRTRGSDQSAGPNVCAGCRPPRTEATNDPSSASAGVITTSRVPIRTDWVVIVEALRFLEAAGMYHGTRPRAPANAAVSSAEGGGYGNSEISAERTWTRL